MQQIKKNLTKKFHLLLLLGVFWIVSLVFLMSLQNKSPSLNNDLTVQTFSAIKENSHSNEPITPLPEPIGLNLQKVSLGFKLFNDKILSHDNTVSCATCHNLTQGGADNLPFSFGVKKAIGGRNSPTVFNSGFNFRQFWDGRAATLEEQVDAPIQNPKEMASSWDEIVKKLTDLTEYQTQFKEIYGEDEITPTAVRDAIATFERALVTTNSRFDLWLKGDEYALSQRQKEGYKLFKSYGCVSCHHGVNVGGTMFEKIGVFNNFYATHSSLDHGRFDITGDKSTQYEFKVPSLRNVALTQPYLHNGSVQTLHETIDLMAKYQLGITLSQSEIEAIEDFLNTLTGETPTVLR